MKPSEYINYMMSPAGRAAVQSAAAILKGADPEVDDAELLERVKHLGFPQWVAARIFQKVLNRFAPLTCKGCEKQFKPRSVRTVDRPWCHQCVRGPLSPEESVKDRARKLAMQALDNGKIKREPCSKCGFGFDLHMHHPDYSRPLHIIWLCARCHGAEHKALNDVSRAT